MGWKIEGLNHIGGRAIRERLPPLRRSPSLEEGGLGASRSLSKPLIQPRVQGRNPARFNGGYGVPRGFKGEKSKFPPNPLGLAERVYSFHRPRGGPPPSKREVFGLRRSRPPALPSIAYRGFAVAPITLRAPARRFLYNSGCRVATLLVLIGGYGVPRGFKGGSKPSAPCGRLSEAEHPKRKGATLLRPLSAVNRNLPLIP